MNRSLLAFLVVPFLLGSQQGSGLDDQILEKGDKLLEEAKVAYEDARAKNLAARFVDAGFKLEEARIKYIVLQEIGSADKQKTAADRLRAVNQLSKLIHDGKVAITGTPADSAPAKSPEPGPAPGPKEPSPDAPQPVPRPAVDVTHRAPVPDAATQKEAERLLRDLFKEQYSKKTPADKQSLARALLAQAKKSQGDPASVWVTCREARDLASQVCDLETLIAALEELARIFDIDTLPLKSADLASAGKAAKTPEDFESLVVALDALIDELMAADQYDSAEKAAASAVQYARRANDPKAVARASSRSKEVSEAKSRYQALKGVLQTLAKTPEDPGANLEMGQFLCLVKGNWDLGLRFLVKSSDALQKPLAEKELALSANPTEAAAVADGWYDLAEKEKVAYRRNQLLAHAKGLYEAALTDAVGLARARIEKRLETIQASVGSTGGDRAPVNLLRLIDLKLDSVSGEFHLDGGFLTLPSVGNYPRLQLPYIPPAEYDLSFVVERKEGSNSLNVGFVVGTSQGMFLLDGGEGDTSGIEMIDGKNFATNETTKKGRFLIPRMPRSVLCSVRKDSVAVSLDGKAILSWKGDPKRLSVFGSWQVPNSNVPFLGSSASGFQISKLILTPVSGSGKKLRP